MLSNLKPKKYKRLENHDEIEEYGLIAQDVEKVIPDIVFHEPNFIPNIYDYCVYDNITKILISKIDISELLTVDTKIKIIRQNGDNINSQRCMCINGQNSNYLLTEAKVIKIIDNYTFQISDTIDIDESELFLYGSLKEDFKTINYQSLHAINIQATKDLYNLIQQQSLLIQDLQNRLSILENK